MYLSLLESIPDGLMILERPELQRSLILILVLGIFFKGFRWFPLAGFITYGPSFTMLVIAKALVYLFKACLVDLATFALVDFRNHFDAFLSQTSMHVAVHYCIDRQTCDWRWIPTNSRDIWDVLVRLTELCLAEQKYTLRAALVLAVFVFLVACVGLGFPILCRKIAKLVMAIVGLITTAMCRTGGMVIAGFNVVCLLLIQYLSKADTEFTCKIRAAVQPYGIKLSYVIISLGLSIGTSLCVRSASVSLFLL